MRLGWMVVGGMMLGLLAACSDEPDFDTRFEKASEEISQRARALDAEDARVRTEMGLAASDDGVQVTGQEPDAATGQPMSFRLPVAGSMGRE
jgi:hypothetical protein